MDDLIADLRELIQETELTRSALNWADTLLGEAYTTLSRARDRLSQLLSPQNSDLAFNLVLADIVEQAPLVLTGEIEEAIARNDEFAYYAFIDPLFEVANNSDLYDIKSLGAGWGRKILVNLRMNEIAGSIDDYANAVEDARTLMNAGKGDAEEASKIWRTKIYKARGGGSLYGLIISTRLSLADSPAPFWSLLNDGNRIVMASDRGGTPYPSKSGTHFVENAEAKISNAFLTAFGAFKEQNETEVYTLRADIDFVQGLVNQVEQRIDNFKNIDFEQAKRYVEEIERPLEKVKTSKLMQYIEAVRRGEEIPARPYIGSGNEGRISRSKIIKLAGLK